VNNLTSEQKLAFLNISGNFAVVVTSFELSNKPETTKEDYKQAFKSNLSEIYTDLVTSLSMNLD
jgi:hypothetical protein